MLPVPLHDRALIYSISGIRRDIVPQPHAKAKHLVMTAQIRRRLAQAERVGKHHIITPKHDILPRCCHCVLEIFLKMFFLFPHRLRKLCHHFIIAYPLCLTAEDRDLLRHCIRVS